MGIDKLKGPFSLSTIGLGVATCMLVIYIVLEFVTTGLRKLPPGPRGLPIFGNLLQLGSIPHQSLYRLSKRYGSLMYLKLGSKDMVVASSPESATAILKTFDHMFCNRPLEGIAFDIFTFSRNTIANGPRWQSLRKICHLPIFSTRSLEEWEHVREAEIDCLLASLFQLYQLGKHAYIGELVHSFVLNIVGQMVIQTRFDKEDASQFKHNVETSLRLANGFRIGDFVPLLRWSNHVGGLRAEMLQLELSIDDFFDRKLKELESSNHNTKALLQLLQSQAEEGQISDAEIKGTVMEMMAAGTDTSSKTIEWAITEVIRHPHVIRKLQEEIDGVVGREEKVRECHLPQLKYLRAVVCETLRLHPPAALMIPHKAPRESSCEVLGYTIPKNSRVVVNLWAIGRNPSRWKDPLKFDPGRFLEDPIDILHAQDFGVIPFGAGRRMCPGRYLGIRMVELAVASLVHAFEWSLPYGESPKNLDMSEEYGVSVSKAIPLEALGIPRLPRHLYCM